MSLHSHELQTFPSGITFYQKICASVGQPELLMDYQKIWSELNRPQVAGTREGSARWYAGSTPKYANIDLAQPPHPTQCMVHSDSIHATLHQRPCSKRSPPIAATRQVESFVHRFGPGLLICWLGLASQDRLVNVQGDICSARDVPDRLLLPLAAVLMNIHRSGKTSRRGLPAADFH
jgi:hypothetical protein